MKLGFIDYYLDEWHANHYPTLLRELSGGEIEVAYAYAETDAPNGLTTDAWCQKNNVQRVNSIAELVALADGIIVLAPDNTERHEELCRLPLQSGKRVYVDKTFAPDAATAARLFRLAQAHGTPCYSTSALRYAAEYQDIDPNTVRAVSSWWPYDFETESVHQLEPILTMIHAAPLRVMMHTCPGWYTLTIEFADGRMATISGFAENWNFSMQLALSDAARTIQVQSDYFRGFLQELVRFFRTGEARVPHSTTVDIMAVRAAGCRAMTAPGTWVTV